MTSDAILVELRSLPGAPDSLRERVRALPEPQPRFAWTFPRIDIRRSLLVLAPAVFALAVGSAALHGVLAGSTNTTAQPPTYAQGAAHVQELRKQELRKATATTPSFAPNSTAVRGARTLTLPPSSTRLNKYNAWLRVRVDDDRLANVTTRAMQIARGYGGYVASVDMNTPGKRGTSTLVLRIPVTKVEDAVLRLGKLGEVTAQRVRIQDLQRQANVLQREILRLRSTIATLQRKLASGSLSPEERIQLQYQLEQARQSLAQKTKARAGTVREGTLATVSLAFFTSQPAAAVPHHQSYLERTTRDAGSFLVRELAWVLYALIVIGPIAVLGAIAVLLVRSARRRSDARLLERA